MSDEDILGRIDELVAEEHRLFARRATGEELSPGDHDRLGELETALDQCWDLLRQRRARREVGADPEGAATRPADVVEHYQQ